MILIQTQIQNYQIILKKLDTKHEIILLYGKLKYNIIGGGSPLTMIPEYDVKDLKKYVKRCTEVGIRGKR